MWLIRRPWRGGILPGREVKCPHGTFHYLIRFIFYSPVKWSQVIQYPWGRVLGGIKTTVTSKKRQFLWLKMFKMSTTQTPALLKLKMKKARQTTEVRTQGRSTKTPLLSKEPVEPRWEAEAGGLSRLGGWSGLHSEFQARLDLTARTCLSQANTQMNKQQSPFNVSEGASHPNFPDSSSSVNANSPLERQGEEGNFTIKIRNAFENTTVFLLLFKKFSQYIEPSIWINYTLML